MQTTWNIYAFITNTLRFNVLSPCRISAVLVAKYACHLAGKTFQWLCYYYTSCDKRMFVCSVYGSIKRKTFSMSQYLNCSLLSHSRTLEERQGSRLWITSIRRTKLTFAALFLQVISVSTVLKGYLNDTHLQFQSGVTRAFTILHGLFEWEQIRVNKFCVSQTNEPRTYNLLHFYTVVIFHENPVGVTINTRTILSVRSARSPLHCAAVYFLRLGVPIVWVIDWISVIRVCPRAWQTRTVSYCDRVAVTLYWRLSDKCPSGLSICETGKAERRMTRKAALKICNYIVTIIILTTQAISWKREHVEQKQKVGMYFE